MVVRCVRPVGVQEPEHVDVLVVARHVPDQRQLIDDPSLTVDDRGELVDGLEVVVGLRTRDGVIGKRLGVGTPHRRDHRLDAFGVDGEVPGVERRHGGEALEQAGVPDGHPEHRLLGHVVGEALRACRDREARPEALQVPLPRAGQGLVEVVHVEDQVSLRSREASEVEEVTVAAELHRDPRARACSRGRRPCPRPRRGRSRTPTRPSARSGWAADRGPCSRPVPRARRPGRGDRSPVASRRVRCAAPACAARGRRRRGRCGRRCRWGHRALVPQPRGPRRAPTRRRPASAPAASPWRSQEGGHRWWASVSYRVVLVIHPMRMMSRTRWRRRMKEH